MENNLEIRVVRTATVPFFIFSQLRSQINHMSQSGVDVLVVCSDGPELEHLRKTTNAKYEVLEIPRHISLLKDTLAVWKLFRILRSKSVDICHSTTPKAGLISMLASFFARTKVRLHTYTGQPWATNSSVQGMLSKISDRIICMLATHTYADSPSQRDFLLQHKICDPSKISVIGQGSLGGVSVARFSKLYDSAELATLRRNFGFSASDFVFIYVGRITPEKGISELLEAFSKLNEDFPDTKLLLVGPVDQSSGTGEKFQEVTANASKHVVFTGFSSNPELFLSLSSVLCLPSYREGFGTVILEAAAMGLPSIGSNIYGLKDAIVDGETGLLVPPRSAKELHEAMKFMRENRTKVAEMGLKAKQRCEMFFNDNLISELTLDEYKKHVKSRYSMMYVQ